MFNVVTKKIGKTAEGEEQKIKSMIMEGYDRGVCDSYGRQTEKYPLVGSGKGSRNRSKKVIDVKALCRRAANNLWPRDGKGNLIGDD